MSVAYTYFVNHVYHGGIHGGKWVLGTLELQLGVL